MNFDDYRRKSISEVLAPFKAGFARYWRVAWAPALAVASLIGVLSIRLPDYFVSDVLIFIQPQKISSKIVEAPEKEEQQERFEALVQELLSRPRLRAIVDKFDLYPGYEGVVGKELAMKKLREDIQIEPVTSPSGKALAQTFRVSYAHSDANMAYEVTKSLSNLFIEESIITQRSETQGTEEFLDSQLREARQRLEQTEAKVQEFVRRNAGKLPEHKEEAMARLENAQQQFATNGQMISANVARLQYLQQELRLAQTAGVGAQSGGNDEDINDPAASLAQLERALVVLKSKYSAKHPDVINTQERISALRSRLKSEGAVSSGQDNAALAGLSPVARTLRNDINEVEVQLARMRQENETLKALIAELDADIKTMPLKHQELTQISRDYANVKDAYEKLLAAKEEAALQSSLVRSQKSSQFKIVDPPSRPVVPAGPMRLLIAAGGLVAGLAVLCLLPVGLFFLNDSYKFRDEVEDETGVPVIGVIPPMKTPAAAIARRRAGAMAVVASVVTFFAGSLLIILVV
ncbi:MAG: hypothetical protein KDD69_00230 [Bdellovibrionales bacterium]|nr:hypothetical protein [Bdellovibrionales bacterium]